MACRFEISCYSIGFEETHYSHDYVNQVVIITDELQILDARTLLHYKIGPRPKVPSLPNKSYDLATRPTYSHFENESGALGQVPTVATVTTGPRVLPVYRYHGHSNDLSEFLFEVEVDTHALSDMGVLNFKELVNAPLKDSLSLNTHLTVTEHGD